MLALRAGVPEGAVLLLYAGRLVPEKNLGLLLETMEHLAGRDGRDYRLLIAGTGSSEEGFRSDAERRLPGYVRFLGHIRDRDDLAHVYANSDVFVHPNPDEPFGIALLEAMAAGLPLVAPNRGGVTTYANETNARLADPSGEAFAEAISRVIEDDAGRRVRCAAARTTALGYRWERVTADYLDLYREIHELARGIATSYRRPPKFCSTPGNWLGLETTRRGFILSFLGAAFSASTSARTTAGACRRYRADATVTLLGIPVFSRSAVGGAYAVIQERPDGRHKRVSIQFAAGSLPDRAHGVNHFGFIQEIVNEQGDAAEGADYLGLMTASPERSFDQAKQSLGGAATMVPFSAVEGSVRGGRFRNRLLRTMFPASLRWTDCPALRSQVLALFGRPGEDGLIVSERPVEVAATFLYTVHRAMLCSSPESEARFLYNGQRYVLCARKQSDARMGRRFAARALVAMPERTIRLTGRVTCLDGESTSDFKLWFEAGTKPALPIRFEFRGRSFLHLAFEHDPSLAEPATIPLIEQEST